MRLFCMQTSGTHRQNHHLIINVQTFTERQALFRLDFKPLRVTLRRNYGQDGSRKSMTVDE
jgi:hypothetical protein